MIAGINRNRVDRCGGNERIICHDCPGSRATAAIGRFPYTAADRAGIRYDAAIDGRSWVDSYRVNSSLGSGVIDNNPNNRSFVLVADRVR